MSYAIHTAYLPFLSCQSQQDASGAHLALCLAIFITWILRYAITHILFPFLVVTLLTCLGKMHTYCVVLRRDEEKNAYTVVVYAIIVSVISVFKVRH